MRFYVPVLFKPLNYYSHDEQHSSSTPKAASIQVHFIFLGNMPGPVQYIVLLDHHSVLFRQQPPLYQRDADGQWTCDYFGSRTSVTANHPNGRMESAWLMWILVRILHPMPRL